jgi:hypothetical protein
VQIVRLYDPSRRPANWTEIIGPRQLAIFTTDSVSGAPRDLDGARFAAADLVSCAIVDSLDEARAVCAAVLSTHPSLRLDVFDREGRTRPPLLTVLHPDRAASLEQGPSQMRRRRAIAWTLIGLGVPQVVYAYLEGGNRERDIVLPVFIGINMILFGGRLLWLNLALRETERAREERLRRLGS